ncbi:hypothetical protein [Dactylosporangium sp. NPDC005555]|uniref:hypothetical protein n=1 Tax=Dactylosporangium sp. NPDC005555 TaxID=3154889 RepID=UPI0033A61409
MRGIIEGMGGRLLAMFVPKISASAGCGSWPSCWQCISRCGRALPCDACTVGEIDKPGEWILCKGC